jgi:hypothetical protein
MGYTVITRAGTVKQFYIKAVAEMYKNTHGGVVFTQQILDSVELTHKSI